MKEATIKQSRPFNHRGLRPLQFRLDGSETVFNGFTDGTRWNGCLNVSVTPATRDAIAGEAALWAQVPDDEESGLADLRNMKARNGLIDLGGGFIATVEEVNHSGRHSETPEAVTS